jgi:hypothetical protein
MRARAFYESALDLDPSNVDALVGVAFVDLFVGISFTIDDPRRFMEAAETKFLKALSTNTTPMHASAAGAHERALPSTGTASIFVVAFIWRGLRRMAA